MGSAATFAEVVAAVAALPSGRTRFVGVDGLGGAGKSSFANALSRAVPGSVVVHVDDLQGVGVSEWDWDVLNRDVVTPLLAGRDARFALRSWGEVEPHGEQTVPAAAVVIVEGVSATRREAWVPWDVQVWLDAPEPVRRRRILERDGPEMQRLWLEHWIPPEEAYVARENPVERMDFVVNAASDDLGEWSS